MPIITIAVVVFVVVMTPYSQKGLCSSNLNPTLCLLRPLQLIIFLVAMNSAVLSVML